MNKAVVILVVVVIIFLILGDLGMPKRAPKKIDPTSGDPLADTSNNPTGFTTVNETNLGTVTAIQITDRPQFESAMNVNATQTQFSI